MRKMRVVAAVVGSLCAGFVAQAPAQAAVISVVTKQALTSTPFNVPLGGGLGTLSFTADSTAFGPGAAVATGGNALVNFSFGAIGDYQVGTVFDGSAAFGSSPSPSTIQYSATDDYIGFSYGGSDGTHYGYAELFGPTLIGYAYESTPGASITANPVPEPASMALVLGGFAGIGMVRRRKRNSGAV